MKLKLLTQSHKSLPDRIEALREECDQLIDQTAAEMKPPGVPIQAIRLTLVSPYGGDVLDSALAILSQQGKN